MLYDVMKNSLLKRIYHFFITKFYSPISFRGGWILTYFYSTDYKNRKTPWWRIAMIHLKGWSYNDWQICGITDKTRKQYLSTAEYASLHPLNGAYSTWIDDKLTLKYILHGTEAGQYMPNYYFELMQDGRVVGLMDLDEKYEESFNGVVELLIDKRHLAFKLLKSSLGIGFYRAEYKDGIFYLNGDGMGLDEFLEKLGQLKGYLVTEYLMAHPDIARLSGNTVGCLRYIIGRKLNGELIDIYSFMRFGTIKSKFVENYNSGGVLAIIRDGEYSEGNILDMEKMKNERIKKHPDTGAALSGKIPFWDDVVEAAHTVAKVMPQMVYMGIDFCITNDNKVKIIEINSLTSLDCIQTDKSIYDTKGGEFFRERLSFHGRMV